MLTNVIRALPQAHSAETANQLAHAWGGVGHAEECDSEEKGGR